VELRWVSTTHLKRARLLYTTTTIIQDSALMYISMPERSIDSLSSIPTS
jgi:hypothetical protein